jgi:hypothetical protein
MDVGYGPLFTRRGTQNILSPMFKDHLVAFTGLIPILNEVSGREIQEVGSISDSLFVTVDCNKSML